MASVSVTEEFFNRNHSKTDGRFSSGGGGGRGSSKVVVKQDWHNANHALNEKGAGPAKVTKATSDVRPGPRSAIPGTHKYSGGKMTPHTLADFKKQVNDDVAAGKKLKYTKAETARTRYRAHIANTSARGKLSNGGSVLKSIAAAKKVAT